MKNYWLRLTPEQPLQLDDPGRIPGRAIRGAVAAVLLGGCEPGHLHDNGPCGPDCRFWPVFGTRTPIRFGNAYAASGDDVAPYPATAMTCSVRPGLASSGQHGVLDRLIRGWSFEESAEGLERMLTLIADRCPVCGADLVTCAGLLVRHGGRHFEEAEVVTNPIQSTHRPIERSRKARLEPFTQSGYVVNDAYTARLSVPDLLDEPLRAALREGLVIGKRRTRGMGAVRAELLPRPDPSPALPDRVASFNRALRMERRFYGAMGVPQAEDDGSWYFTLDFPAGLVLNYARQPSILGDVKALRRVVTVRQWLKTGPIGGRSTATGMRIRTRRSVTGALLCRVPPEEDRVALEQALVYLETNGLGSDRDRGCGDVIVCDPFHLEMEPL